MVTEPTAARKPRARSLVPPWARLLWLGALLFGLLYAHGLHADSSAGHTTPGGVATAPVGHFHEQLQASVDDRGTDGAPTHAVPDCATGQPSVGSDVLPPAASPLDAERALDGTAGTSSPAVTVPPAASPCPASVVLRI
ncbi:hypothetical protein Q5762_26790 [Streptomyces sp. P9(2023)]|uniref:hypothetical protein n=1 Tax=Streptomyces sp. P9(2023) TaxID=3064394 RepID=UPI0028F45020|nr:hypothetical protein [Streptomyces sp. P9(2023)]MDT9691875.1 hypothetical protein [Streptomyces sp. P9(2023)]